MKIGEVLRQARKARVITLEEAENVTKIRRKYLEALENEQFHVLPERTYARCFLSTYARFLELNAIELIQVFDKTCPPQEEGETKKPAGSPRARKATGRKRKVAVRVRLASSRDAYLVAKMRKIMSEKKNQPWWWRLGRFF